MATMYRTTVCGSYSSIDVHRDEAETVIVEGMLFVRLPYGTMLPCDARWAATQAEADQIALPELERWRAAISSEIDAIKNRPLPAAAATHDSAAGRAHAGVAK